MIDADARGGDAHFDMPRIIGGEFRSRMLFSPRDEKVSRPYSDRVKETVFNLLRGWFEGARVLDLFAGVGTMGLEAVSRGAREVVLVERDRSIFRLLEQNISNLGCGDRARAILADALAPTTLMRISAPVEVVFLDPPYAMMEDESQRRRVLDQAARIAPILARPGFLVMRSPIEPGTDAWRLPGLDGPETHQFGREMNVLLYSPVAEPSQPHAPAARTLT